MQTLTKTKTFLWQGINPNGNIITGELTAASLNLARLRLQQQGINLKSIRTKNPFTTQFNTHITSKDITVWLRQLATLIIANIPLAQAIHILAQNTQSKSFTKITTTLQEDIHAGKEFASSLKKFPRHFDIISCSLIQAGEKTGALDIMLARIASHKETAAVLKNKAFQALLYPTIISIVATVVTIIMLTFVVPRFAELFASAHSSLPYFTQIIIHLSNLLRSYGWLLIIPITGLTIFWYQMNRFPRIKTYFDHALLHIPYLGDTIQKYILARLARNLATIYAAGIPITEALKILAPTTGNSVYANAISQLYFDISRGKQLHFAMQTCKIFPALLTQMVQVGEESGTLDKMLAKTAEFYEADIDHLLANLSRLLEPLIMLILGVVIGGLVIAMYLPIFKLGNVI